MNTAAPLHPLPTPAMRLRYVGYLAAGLAALASAALACGAAEPRLVLVAALAGFVAWLLRARLAESGELAACAKEDDSPVTAHRATDNQLATERRQLAVLEAKRGTPAFDPWQTLELRRRIAAQSEPRP